MKEFLEKQENGGYKLVYHKTDIEVPEGADAYTFGQGFYKNNGSEFFIDGKKWIKNDYGYQSIVLWVRPTHPEPLPFIDDNPQSLNDQYAEIEQVRQNQKIINAMREADGILIQKHSHYRKSVKHLDFIDPYRIAQLYDLHPCADHIAKKALCTGKRGHKDLMRDIQDIIDTAERWKQMIQEDQNAI